MDLSKKRRREDENSSFQNVLFFFFTHRLHLRTITIIIAPNIADITETIINVKAHPSSPAASEIERDEKNKKKKRKDY